MTLSPWSDGSSRAEACVRLTPLGGVGRFGRNCLLVEHAIETADGVELGDAILVDCGVRFAGPELPGFDAALPDFERLAAVAPRLRAIILTHGHEDHIGALPFVLRDVLHGRSIPCLATAFTAHFIRRRCARYDVDIDLQVQPFGAVHQVGGFDITFAAVSHSIPGAASVIIGTPVGPIVHSGDFRVDTDPVLGPPTDLVTLSTAAGATGVRCLLADSTGALSAGAPLDVGGTVRAGVERSVAPALRRCLVNDDGEPWRGLVVVGLFASHLQRLALLAEICRAQGRKLLLMGKGLAEVFAMAQNHVAEGDLLVHGEGGGGFFADVVVNESTARNLPRHRLCIAATGTQGEENAVLARMARGDAQLPFAIDMGDRVVFSARVIPGNELKVQQVIDALVDRGVDVVVGKHAPHVSGHGGADDLQMLLAATRPRTFVALHGTPGHLVAHGQLASAVGVADKDVVGLRDGHTLVLTASSARHVQGAPAAEPAVVDGEICDFPRGVARSRLRLQESGVVVLTIERYGEHVVINDVVARGVFPPIDTALKGTLANILTQRHQQGSPLDDEDAERALSRPWKKHWRPAPTFVVVLRDRRDH